MPTFSYEAKTSSGDIYRATIEAASLREAAKLLSDDGLFVHSLSLLDQSNAASTLKIFRRSISKRYPVIFLRRLSVMLGAGLTVTEALSSLAAGEKNSEQAKRIKSLQAAVESGATLSAAMATLPELFSPTVVALVAAGEMSGELDTVLLRTADSAEASYAARQKLITVLLYPAILLLCAFFAAVFIISFVLPSFRSLFLSFKTPLPLPTRFLLGVADIFSGNGFLIFAVILALFFLLYALYRREEIRFAVDRLLLRLPLFGEFFLFSELQNIFVTLSLLLESGIVIDKALALLSKVTQNLFLRRSIENAMSDVLKGQTLSGSLEKSAALPPMFIGLLSAGEKTGEMEQVLMKASLFCAFEASTLSERVRIFLETASLLFASLITVGLVLSIALPLFDSFAIFS